MYRRFLVSRWRWFKREIKKTDGRKWLVFLSLSIVFLLVGFVLLVLAGYYLHINFENLPPLPDLGHQILPFWQIGVRFLFSSGLGISFILFLIGAMNEPHRTPYLFFMVSFWMLIRVASMTITPLGPPADVLRQYPPNFDIQTIWDLVAVGLFSPNILFFSGHTGLPFLGYLLFRQPIRCGFLAAPLAAATGIYLASITSYSPVIGIILLTVWILCLAKRKSLLSFKTLFLVWSFIMAAVVLVAREHYSIDVLGAYFMTGGVFLIGRTLFRKVEDFCEKLDKTFETEE